MEATTRRPLDDNSNPEKPASGSGLQKGNLNIPQFHLDLLDTTVPSHELDEASLAPIIAGSVLNDPERLADNPATPQALQFGLLAGLSDTPNAGVPELDPRLLFNVTSPSSTFICGSQGSGKSHTLSCLLENCLLPSKAGKLPNPLTGVVFHYDTFISDTQGSPCEAAFLSSSPDVNVRVLCSPTNIRSIRASIPPGTYSRFKIPVDPLQIDETDLNTKRMMDLMVVGQDEGPIPLYMHTVQRILREMRIAQQQAGSQFNYNEFKQKILGANLTPGQLEPLKQRLDTLESFMPQAQTISASVRKKRTILPKNGGSKWNPVAGRLTIVDLSCPCISPDTACSLFNICLGIFLEQETSVGRVVALDEAHKYMTQSGESRGFTETLLSVVRLQRHLAARVIISTQEPTISPALLNLCSVTIVHRFTSPEWLRMLHHHLAAAADDPFAKKGGANNNEDGTGSKVGDRVSLFNRIVGLRVGEALLFAPSAVVGVLKGDDNDGKQSGEGLLRLGSEYLVVKIRKRITDDGGMSVLAL
ncbi:hypothetical protein BO71DRAFT_371757 [Aspergillus ellipticus CBS 707.79]|uniref:P-loop containing nucleoside triphosphate hydrolase protein n=1 Tax=Aspergillus ellipticus CBS 707.79 TaxID=1448320 RepID=A0A319DNG8_9EURO|nr:hypothetical protein BO71DRAFT_371757 [Aspergillus ellipticus CBS 707.79]